MVSGKTGNKYKPYEKKKPEEKLADGNVVTYDWNENNIGLHEYKMLIYVLA